MGELTLEQQRALALASARRQAEMSGRQMSPEQAATTHDAAYRQALRGPNANTPEMGGVARTDNPMQGMTEFAARSGNDVLDMGRARAEARRSGGYVPEVPASPETVASIDAMRDRVGRAGDAPIQEAVRFGEGMVNTAAGPVDAAALARQLRDESPALAASVAAMQGLPFVGSWSDELIGQIGGAIGTNDPAVITEVARQIDQTYSEDMPVTSGLIKLASGLGAGRAMALTATPAVRATAPNAPLARMGYGAAAGATAGAAEGAIYGAGEGQGADRVGTAERGATVGAVAGAALGGAVPILAPAVRGIRNFFTGTPVRDAARALGVSPEVVETLRASLMADEAAGRVNIGAGGMLADAGSATSGVLDTAVQGSAMGSPLALSRITDRATEAGNAVVQAFDDVLGAPAGRIASTSAIRAETSPAVNEAYAAAREAVIDVSTPQGQAVVDVLNRMPQSALQNAVDRANEMLRFEGSAIAPLQITRNAQGQIEIAGDLGVAHLDYIKRALDDVRRDGYNPLTGRFSADARFAGEMATQVRNAARNASPEYAAALDLAAPQQARMAAIETGNQVMRDNITMDQAREMLGDMTAPERTAAAQGVRDYIDHQLARVRATAGEPNVDVRQVARAVADLSSDLTRGKLTLLVGAEDSARIMDALDRASVVINLRARTAAGSRTAGRQATTEAGAAALETGIINNARSGHWREAASEIIGTATGSSAADRNARRAGFYAELADILTRSDDGEAVRALNLLREVNVMEPISRERATVIANQVAAILAAEGARQAGGELR